MSDLTTTFTNIANAIRNKTGSSDTMTPSEMPNEIAGIETPMDSINITQNGTYEPSEGRGYNQVIVEVPAPTLITKTITKNGTYNASSDNADGYSQVTVAVEGFKKKSIANTPTDIASFDDGTANPMPSLEISIEPVQSGSGDPSPSNVRPISGWSGANVSRTGKNLLPSAFSSYSINNNYAFMNGVVPDGETARFTLIDKDTSVDISGCSIGFQTGLTEQTNSPSAYRWVINNGVEQTNKSNISSDNVVCDGVMIYPKNQTTFNKFFARYDIMVELGSSATAYEPYQGSILSIPFHDSSDNPITFYGGRLNVTTGELTVTMANVDLGSLNYINMPTSEKGFYTTQIETKGNKGFCEVYAFVDGETIYSGSAPDKSIGFTSSGNSYRIRIKDTSYPADESGRIALKSALNGVKFVYELATPQTYQLTPAQVTTLLGQNNIFADCGQILEGEYFVTL